ncbi:DUF58 domain-containing protein [Micromonospora rifamycinica]|uniref:Uncharacterized conserved protein, DUF58 family, contains vWF domain n=1 Tax=Micromonospora rifamycinica TaxID=291594 RepID=A0A125Q0T1_9ACTN|nr:DUF58 domain-containing protein [Micromonospora rifamycinica]KWV29975.1 hypothetical protein AWV63_25550 [Micromonospora rifamycinica]SCG81338.1 Uncharacterized conserved protein, DUF58 family, contains vWF domain [Micromonospora rifamycinica]
MGLTTRGTGLLVAATALLGSGLRFGYPELTVLGAAGAVAVGQAVLGAARRPRLVVAREADPDRVAVGEPARMTLTVRNAGRLRVTSLLAEDRCAGRPVPVPLLRLRPGRDTTCGYDVPTRRRGVLPVGPLRVTRRDPLGLCAATRPYGSATVIRVHPRVFPLTAVPTGAGRSLDGRVDGVPHGSITFDSLREYVVGDELRRVHWRTSARVGELMVRENVDTSLPRIVVLLDNRATAHPDGADGVAGSFEAACEAAASLVVAAFRQDLPVVLLLVDPADDRATDPALDRLAAVALTGTGPGDPPDGVLGAAVTRLRRERPGDTLVFLTGPGGRDDLGRVGALRGAYPSVVVGMFGAAGPTPAAAGPVVLDAADGAAFAAAWDAVRRW